MVEVVDDSMSVVVELKEAPTPDPDCYAGETKTELCSDGSTIITHTCVSGNWVATGNVCPEDPTPYCYAGETKTKLCSDGSTIITHTCVGGNWEDTGNECPTEDETDIIIYLVAGGMVLMLYLLLER